MFRFENRVDILLPRWRPLKILVKKVWIIMNKSTKEVDVDDSVDDVV